MRTTLTAFVPAHKQTNQEHAPGQVVNPDHLFTGTAKENTTDMFNKGRRSRVIRNPQHRLLSFSYAQEIRTYHQSHPEMNNLTLADKFNTSPAQISRILNNKIWVKEY
jgi:hypothetical protein